MTTTPSLWRYIPSLVIYPLHTEALLVLLLVSTGLWLFSSSLFGLVLVITFLTALLQYTLTIIGESAAGHFQPPTLTSRDTFEFDTKLFQFLAAIVLFASLVHGAGRLANELGWLLSLAAWIIFPAFMMLLAVSGSFSLAMSPARLLRVLRAGGPVYFVLGIGLSLSWHHGLGPASTSILDDFELEALIFSMPTFDRFIHIFLASYLTLVFGHLLGFVAYQHQDSLDLGIRNNGKQSPDHKGTEVQRQRILEELDTLLREQRQAIAEELLQHHVRDMNHIDQNTMLDGLINNRLWSLVRGHAMRVIAAQLAANRADLAAFTILRMQHHFSDFHTRTAAEWLLVCQAALRDRPEQGFEKLAQQAEDFYPAAPELVDIALLQAGFYANYRNNPKQAAAVLRPYRKLDSHPKHRQLLALLDALEKS